jgi:hypothetical protein
MKKILVVVCIVIVTVAAAYYLYPRPKIESSATNNGTSTSTSQTVQQPILINNFSFNDNENGNLGGEFSNASTGVKIDVSASNPYQSQNEAIDVYINGKKITQQGQLAGMAFSALGFSPDNNYFVFRTRAISGAYRYGYNVYAVNLMTDKILSIAIKVQSDQYASSGIEFWDVYPYAGSYSWSGSSTLDVVSYLLGTYYNEARTLNYYRVSPEETWSYDLTTGSSTLIQTTP